MNRSFQSIDDVIVALLRDLFIEGTPAAPRNRETIELLSASFRLNNPRARRISIKARRWSEELAVGELCWHLSGSDNVEGIAYYAKMWEAFSEDGEHIRGSCYGKTIFSRTQRGETQWDNIKRLLVSDPFSRRAVLVLADPTHNLELGLVDVACVSTVQFLLREGRLNCIVSMRSNDVIWGLPYDVYLFTMLQERLSCELGVELGWYQHVAGSLHLYANHQDLAKTILAEGAARENNSMSPMTDIDSIPAFLALELALRLGEPGAVRSAARLPSYWKYLAKVLVARHQRKQAFLISSREANQEADLVRQVGR